MTRLIAVGALLLAVACGDDNKGDSVAERCYQTATGVCERVGACGVELGQVTAADRSGFVADCKSGFLRSLDCSRQTKLAGNPDACQADLEATPCKTFDEAPDVASALPASCFRLYAE
jgi:hypothetical protein